MIDSTLPAVRFRNLGRLDYQAAWDLQTELHAEVVARKRANRDRRKAGEQALPQYHHLLFVEHPPVYTLGKSGSTEHLLLSEVELAERGFTFYKINRGGDITYHGPGQLVAYPIFDLEEFFTDVHRYVRDGSPSARFALLAFTSVGGRPCMVLPSTFAQT